MITVRNTCGKNMRAAYQKISVSASLEMRNLYKKEGWRGKDIAGNFKQYYPRAINCHMKKKLNDRSGDKRKFNGAQKKKTTEIVPTRSLDLNPIENFFHQIKSKLKKDAIFQKVIGP